MSFSDGFTNTTHKAAGAVDIVQIRGIHPFPNNGIKIVIYIIQKK